MAEGSVSPPPRSRDTSPAPPAASAKTVAMPIATDGPAPPSATVRGQEKSAERIYNGKRERQEAFKQMLAEHNIDPEMEWKEAMGIIIGDERFTALKSLKDKMETFKEYCKKTKRERELQEKIARRKMKEDFRQMLEDCKEMTPHISYIKAEMLFSEDPRWQAVKGDEERRNMYEDYMLQLEEKEKERQNAVRMENMVAFRQLL
eukprot:Sspe_Gene.115690::Locus_103356_Transcript_1_1_Confidence_1.000_Length_712::g.115690::m.115690/K12821/PRPF40, PRP40; pre-mRNA-processing factor 40